MFADAGLLAGCCEYILDAFSRVFVASLPGK